MKVNMKKVLLTGTAVLAVSAFAQGAHAQNVQYWDSAANPAAWADIAGGATPLWVNATHNNKNIQVNDDATLTINTADAIIGSNVGGFVSANNAIVAAAAGKTLIIDNDSAGAATNVVVNGNISRGTQAAFNVTFAGDAAFASSYTVNGHVDLGTGNLTVTGAANAPVTANLTGNVTATNLTLTGDATGLASAVFNGNGAQVVNAVVAGGAANSAVVVANAHGVTFNKTVTAAGITVDNGVDGSSLAIFKDNVTGPITLGKAGNTSGTNRVVFGDAATADLVVAGIVKAAGGTEQAIVDVVGGKKVTQNAAWGGAAAGEALTTLNIAAGTTLDSDGTINAQSIFLNSNSVLDASQAITGDVLATAVGLGTLSVTTGTSVTGNIGTLWKVDVADGETLLLNAGGAARSVRAGAINLKNVAGGATASFEVEPGTFADSQTITIDSPIYTDVNGEGNVLVLDVVAAGARANAVFNRDIGTVNKAIDNFGFTLGTNEQTVITRGNVYATTATLDANDTWNILGNSGNTGHHVAIRGDIQGRVAGNGTVVVGDSVNATHATFLSASGATGAATNIGTFKVADRSTAELTDNFFVNNATATGGGFDIDGTLDIDSTRKAITLENTDVGAFMLDGTLMTYGDNIVTIKGTGGIAAARDNAAVIVAGSRMQIDGNLVIGDGVNGTDVLTILVNPHRDVDAFVPGQGKAGSVITQTGGVELASNGILRVGMAQNSSTLESGTVFKLIDSTVDVKADGANTTYTNLVQNGRVQFIDTGLLRLAHFTGTGSDVNKDLDVIVTFADARAVVGKNYGAGANALMNFGSAQGVNGTLASFRDRLLLAPTADAARDIAESIQPTVDGGAYTAVTNANDAVFGLTGARLASLRNGGAGMSTGNAMGLGNVWAQVFGQRADQGTRNGVAGFDADTFGVAIGTDAEVMSGQGNLGVAFSYGNTDVKSKGLNNAKNEVDSYQLTVYGGMDLTPEVYLDGAVSYAWNDVETERRNVGLVNGLYARGDYNADQFGIRLEAGRPFHVDGGLTLTPSVLANYQHYSPDGYTEKGNAGNALLRVENENMNLFEMGVGLDAEWNLRNNDGSALKPGLHAGYRYDFVNDDVATTARFTGGGASFKTTGIDQARSTFNVGGGITWETNMNWELSAEYDYEFKSDYNAHSGIVRAGYKF